MQRSERYGLMTRGMIGLAAALVLGVGLLVLVRTKVPAHWLGGIPWALGAAVICTIAAIFARAQESTWNRFEAFFKFNFKIEAPSNTNEAEIAKCAIRTAIERATEEGDYMRVALYHDLAGLFNVTLK